MRRPLADALPSEDRDALRAGAASYLVGMASLLAAFPLGDLLEVCEALLAARARGGTIFLLGNGGSAATASHVACDLAKGTQAEGVTPFRVVALTDNVPLLTAWANDVDYDAVFARQLEPLVEPGDVVLAFSGSGNSSNVLRAIEAARARGAVTVGITGFQGGRLGQMADLSLVIPAPRMQQVEDFHLMTGHLLALCLEEALRREAARGVATSGAPLLVGVASRTSVRS